jgi:outer membrane protein assembly factor BamD (BamD/ComL family)
VSEAFEPSTQARAAGTSSVAAFPLVEGRAAPPRTELERRSQLEEEAALLRRARAELRGNRLADAFATLEASREKFSLPELSQEREALLIELLFQSGQRASAVEKARRFLVQYPNSPHAAQVRSIAQADAR